MPGQILISTGTCVSSVCPAADICRLGSASWRSSTGPGPCEKARLITCCSIFRHLTSHHLPCQQIGCILIQGSRQRGLIDGFVNRLVAVRRLSAQGGWSVTAAVAATDRSVTAAGQGGRIVVAIVWGERAATLPICGRWGRCAAAGRLVHSPRFHPAHFPLHHRRLARVRLFHGVFATKGLC